VPAQVVIRSADDARLLIQALIDLPGILDTIGAIMRGASKEAFEIQRFGDARWLYRYPNQGRAADFVNIAGALSDLNEGTEPKDRRFDRRPALKDTGALQFSVASRIVGTDGVEVGSALPYAQTMQAGGVTSQTVSQVAKDTLARWLKTPKGRAYRSRLAFLLDADTLETDVVPRPFVGVTDEMRGDFVEMVEEVVADALGGTT